jgi:hypothetical protein
MFAEPPAGPLPAWVDTWFPPPPEVPDAQCASARHRLRYEDVAQDGRLCVVAMPQAIGEAVWRASIARHNAAAHLRERGVLPILTRLVCVGGAHDPHARARESPNDGARADHGLPDGPLDVNAEVESHGRWALARSGDADDAGNPTRLYLNTWAQVEAPRGRTHGPPPEGAGRTQTVARVFAEHVFTRPFAPPAERRVTRLDVPGMPTVPALRYVPAGVDELLALPPGATPMGADGHAFVSDTVHTVFGPCHTDSNQHVNSLVYPRLCEEAVLRRLHAVGETVPRLCRAMELLFRKPSFAGDRVWLELRTFRLPSPPGATGASPVGAQVAVHGVGDPPGRPRCVGRLVLR